MPNFRFFWQTFRVSKSKIGENFDFSGVTSKLNFYKQIETINYNDFA